jgi:predicted transcriptional regulator
LWEMLQNEQKRTQQVMLICDQLRQELHELKQKELTAPRSTSVVKQAEEKERKLQPIAYDKLILLSKYARQIFRIERMDFANAIVHILYTLYQLKGRATPDQIFTAADVTDISGFRYVRKLKTIRMLQYHPTSNKGLYLLTEVGKKFVQGKITTLEEYLAVAKIESMWNLQEKPVYNKI